jgi:hypothetical protein
MRFYKDRRKVEGAGTYALVCVPSMSRPNPPRTETLTNMRPKSKIAALLSSVTTGLVSAASELKLKPRDPSTPHRLPKGWRWLLQGEWARVGDYCCDPRIQAVKITDGTYGQGRAWKMTPSCHPVRRKN